MGRSLVDCHITDTGGNVNMSHTGGHILELVYWPNSYKTYHGTAGYRAFSYGTKINHLLARHGRQFE